VSYTLSILDPRTGMWSRVASTPDYPRAVRWVLVIRRRQPEVPVRIVTDDGILRRLHDYQ
jgi:hypothetical protein